MECVCSKKCDKAFSALKEQLALQSVLVHYNVNLLLKLACDASSYGLGAVISHIKADNSEKSIA